MTAMAQMRKKEKIGGFIDADLRKVDSAGRIGIGREFTDKLFAIQPQPNGDILLSPVVVRHEREAWLYDNPEAMEMVKRGLAESAAGEVSDLGSFIKFSDDE